MSNTCMLTNWSVGVSTQTVWNIVSTRFWGVRSTQKLVEIHNTWQSNFILSILVYKWLQIEKKIEHTKWSWVSLTGKVWMEKAKKHRVGKGRKKERKKDKSFQQFEVIRWRYSDIAERWQMIDRKLNIMSSWKSSWENKKIIR